MDGVRVMAEPFTDWLLRCYKEARPSMLGPAMLKIISEYGSEQYQAGMAQESRWHPVSELPIKGRAITICHISDRWIETVDYDSYNNYSLNMFEKATHWRYIELPVLEGER